MLGTILKSYVYPVVTLTGGIMGVGFLSLPYIALRSGIWVMFFYLVALTGLVLTIHVIFGKICLVTPDFKRWPGFVEFYFGRASKFLILPLIITGTFGVLVVYLIVGSQFLTATFAPIFGGNQVLYVLIYWGLAALLVFWGVGVIAKFDFWVLIFLSLALVIILMRGGEHMSLGNLLARSDGWRLSDLFLPYGAILFSLWGTGLIPEVEEMIAFKKQMLTRIIAMSILIPAVFYLLFIVLVLSITGDQTTEAALTGIRDTLGNGSISFILLMGVASTFLACVASGLLLKKVFMYDMGISELPSFLLVSGIPLVLFFMGFNSFIPLISFIGGVLLGVEGVLILIIYHKIGGKKIVIFPIMAIFILGIIYSVVNSVGLI
jgi:amino acid permease